MFISHASEDKQAVALPLAESLIRSGLKVWLDQFELRIGDSLRGKIDQGLSESCFGVVILSEHFFDKRWPKNELNGLVALEEDGVKVILPVWHRVDKATVAQHSPILADRLAASTEEGIPAVARAISQVILEERGTRLLKSAGPTLAGQLVEVLNRGPSPASVTTFLTNYPKVLPTALGHFGIDHSRARYVESPRLGDVRPDLAIGRSPGTAEIWEWWFFFFCTIDGPFFDKGKPVGAMKPSIAKLRALLEWISDRPHDAAKALGMWWTSGDPDPKYTGVILAGRRDRLHDDEREGVRTWSNEGVQIRSYDWLLEACAEVEERSR